MDDFGHEARLADTWPPFNADDASLTGADGAQRVHDLANLLATADHGRQVGGAGHVQCFAFTHAQQRVGDDRIALAFHLPGRLFFPIEIVLDAALGGLAHQDLAGAARHHQAGGQIDFIAQDAVGAVCVAAISAGAHASLADADLHRGDEGELRRWLLQRQRRGRGAGGVVLVGDGRAEVDVDVAAFIADVEVDQGALVAFHHRLHPTHVAVEFFASGGIVVVVDAAEAQEEGDGGAQFGQKVAQSLAQPRVDRRQQPTAQDRFVHAFGGDGGPGLRRRDVVQRLDDGEGAAIGGGAHCGDFNGVAQTCPRARGDDDFAPIGLVLCCRQSLQCGACQRVDDAYRRIAHEPAPHRTGGNGSLQRQGDGAAEGGLHGVELLHGLLHGQRTGDGVASVVAVEPAGDGVSGKGDGAAAPVV